MVLKHARVLCLDILYNLCDHATIADSLLLTLIFELDPPLRTLRIPQDLRRLTCPILVQYPWYCVLQHSLVYQ